MFRENPGHTGVSTETAINGMTAGSLTLGWTATVGSESYASPAVVTNAKLGEAVVYAGGATSKGHGIFYAYPAAGGAPIWSYTLPNGSDESSPSVFGNVVYFTSADGTLYALNATTGKLVCSFATGQFTQASPVVVNDPDGSGPLVYFGTAANTGGAEFALYGAGNTHGACAVDWRFTKWKFPGARTSSSPAYGTDAKGVPLVVFGSADPDNAVYALNANTGALAWYYRTSHTLLDLDVDASPAISPPGQNGFAGGVVYVEAKDSWFYALNLSTGKLIWRYPLVKGTSGDVSSAALVGNRLYVGSDTGVYAFDAITGKLLWHVMSQYTFYASPAISGPPAHRVLITASITGTLYALNPAGGATIWSKKVAKGIWGSTAISQGTIYLAGKDGVLRTYAPSAG
jgi:outer membrane protein assembly factor BamB